MSHRRYHPHNHGHAPGHLRAMLDGYLETGEVPVEELYDPSDAGPDPIWWLTGQLWNCTDILSSLLRDEEDGIWTYGQAARAIRVRLREERQAAAESPKDAPPDRHVARGGADLRGPRGATEEDQGDRAQARMVSFQEATMAPSAEDHEHVDRLFDS